MNAGDLVSGKYRLQRALGAGSMGSVWAARNELTNRDFAVKFLRADLARDDDALQRFFLEARACGQIRHPAIVDVYDMGQAEDGSPYLVMELLEGEGFDQRLHRQGRLDPIDVCRWVMTIAGGLEEAHTRGLVHRDIKPGNIFFAVDTVGDVHPKVLDFGISKETSNEAFGPESSGAVLGSPAYMSPEQAGGELDVDARTDIWSLGVLMYEALTGQLPFDANNYNALMVCIMQEPHAPVTRVAPEVPAALSEVVDLALAKNRHDRIKSAGELAARLEGVLSTVQRGDGVATSSDPTLVPFSDNATPPDGWIHASARQHPARWRPLLGAGVVVALAAGGGFMLTQRSATTAPSLGRISAPLNATVARAERQLAEAVADRRTAAAEEAAREAERRAEQAESKAQWKAQSQAEAERAARSGVAPPRRRNPSNAVHGGVDDPGF
ncbi:MAG: serine/threonine-protein kinase [Myxococcota bacterium]